MNQMMEAATEGFGHPPLHKNPQAKNVVKISEKTVVKKSCNPG